MDLDSSIYNRIVEIPDEEYAQLYPGNFQLPQGLIRPLSQCFDGGDGLGLDQQIMMDEDELFDDNGREFTDEEGDQEDMKNNKHGLDGNERHHGGVKVKDGHAFAHHRRHVLRDTAAGLDVGSGHIQEGALPPSTSSDAASRSGMVIGSGGVPFHVGDRLSVVLGDDDRARFDAIGSYGGVIMAAHQHTHIQLQQQQQQQADQFVHNDQNRGPNKHPLSAEDEAAADAIAIAKRQRMN